MLFRSIPLIDITNSLVHAEDGGAVHSVMVGGRMVVAAEPFHVHR